MSRGGEGTRSGRGEGVPVGSVVGGFCIFITVRPASSNGAFGLHGSKFAFFSKNLLFAWRM